MELNHSFTVNQPIAETWQILTDLERIAPCLPGAQLQEVHGEVYKGVVKIKVGPIT
ncbi:MAG: CoxG family protein, partial [Ilumatobacteraceae bacterium]